MLVELKVATSLARRAVAAAICPSMVSYSASGEDLLARYWISLRETDPSAVRYLDVGAAHPTRLNNTFLLYSRGGTGVLVEPDPEQARRLATARPRDAVVNAGVAFDENRTLIYTRMSDPLFGSFSADQISNAIEQSQSWPGSKPLRIVGSVQTKLFPANELLARYFGDGPLHFLSIDVEGTNFEVFKSIDFRRFKPWIVCVEAQAPVDAHLQILGSDFRLIFQSPDNFMFARV